MNMRFIVFALYVLFTSDALFAYRAPEPRSYIVQFSQPVQEHVLAELAGGRFRNIIPLNPEKTLWEFGIDPVRYPEYMAVSLIRSLPHYQLHQENTEIRFRSTTPSDTLFNRQWHLPLIGAPEAWDISRYGVNRNGDTIVIAVIDDGLHVNHPDFKGNIWINYADTAGNGIDDDSNGYTDDHYGWNFMSNNNDVSDSDYYEAGHGTPVAGIIGARGNNVTGISGIMWHVKLMIVNLADTGFFKLPVFQSDVLRAYSYVLHQRKLYQSSGGKKGAFVVATNSSWGVDGKFPHQAPLWCGFYDTLGKYGILTAGAVSNIQNDQQPVDVTGDLPTLCPSPHLIAVGASTSSDMPFSSGWSTVSVDLSAPGSGLFSSAAYTKLNIQNGSLYRSGFSGTSYAAPMISGAIGMLHSHACARVLDSIRTNPAKGNLMIRKFLLDGADRKDGLSGKTLTGARLNIRRSLEIMDQYCYGYVSVKDTSIETRILLLPNPGNGKAEILSDLPVEQIWCTDLTGRQSMVPFEGSTADMSGLADGIYFLRIKAGGKEQVLRYVKTSSY